MSVDYQVLRISKDKLYPNSGQPRKHITEEVIEARQQQLEQEGQLTPILVFPVDSDGRHELVDGECRWRAAMASETIEFLNAQVYQGDREDIGGLVVTQLLRNDDGSEPLTALEKAMSYKRLISHLEHDDERGSALKQSADRLGMDYTEFSRALKVAEMSRTLSEFVLERGIDDRRVINGLMRIERMGSGEQVDDLFDQIRQNDCRKERQEETLSTRKIVASVCKDLKEGRALQKRVTKDKIKRKLAARKIQLKEKEGSVQLVIETPREIITFDVDSEYAALLGAVDFGAADLSD